MLFADLNLARRIEAVDVQLSMATAAAHERLNPGRGAASEAVAGGCMTFVGVGSPLTHALGIGLDDAVSAEELERIEEFYRSRAAGIELVLCPHAHESLIELLGDYRLKEVENLLVLPLAGWAPAPPPPGILVRRAELNDIDVSARTISGAFLEGEEVGLDALELFSMMFHVPATASFLGYVDNHAAAGGMVAIYDGVASVNSAGTLPEFRNRGLQTALLNARLEYAAHSGCDLAVVSARPGSTSQRNAERQGFRVAYTRTVLRRE